MTLPKITLLFTALHALLMMVLVYRVVTYRRGAKIGLGDGGDTRLLRRMRVHANFIEYVPIALLLLALLEVCGLDARAVWALGGTLLLSRLLHAWGLSSTGGVSIGRFWGTLLTWLVLVVAALAGVWLAWPLG